MKLGKSSKFLALTIFNIVFNIMLNVSIINSAPHLPNWGKSPEQIFTYCYKNNIWCDPNTVSGVGSNLQQTAKIRKKLPALLDRFKINSILDVPCGDFYWMRLVNIKNRLYIGGDIVKDLIKSNQKKFGNNKRKFKNVNILNDKLPKVDLILCRDLFVHLPFSSIFQSLKNIKNSGSKYLLTTTNTRTDRINHDIEMGDWRRINLQKPPFNFPNPIAVINEHCTEHNGESADKSLALWRIKDLPDMP